MGELVPSQVEARQQDVEELQNIAITAVAFGIIFELLARSEVVPKYIEAADKIAAGASGVVAVGAMAGSAVLGYKNWKESKVQEESNIQNQPEQPPLV